MEGNAIAPKENVLRSVLGAMGSSILCAALMFAFSLGTAPFRFLCVATVAMFGVGFVSRRFENWGKGRPKSYHRIAWESFLTTAGLLLAVLVTSSVTEEILLPVRFYLWYGPTIFLMYGLIEISERRRLEKSARRRAELERWSWEYEAKRRVEEMKSAP